MIPSFSRQSITKIRAGQKEVRGTIVDDWSHTTTETISPVLVQPAQSSISLDGRVLEVTDTLKVYCNIDVDILAGDRIVFENDTYTVNEAPRIWESPTGAVSTKQFTMVKYQG